MKNPQYEIGEEDKMELFNAFFKRMIDFGYTPEFIGKEMAYLSRALEQAVEQQKP